MNMQSPTEKLRGVWVRLHLVPQTESTNMPLYIEGFLTEETPGSYVLQKTIELVEDEETYDIKPTVNETMRLINRTYVWSCDILNKSPLEEEDGEAGAFLLESGDGGMG